MPTAVPRRTTRLILGCVLCAIVQPVRGASEMPSAAEWRRTPFVIGAPGRLDGEDDRRLPRRYQRADSAIAAYADVELIADPTWLAQEVDAYARRALDCSPLGTSWCRREVRRVDGGGAIFLASGARAELVWPAAPNVAVRLGWRRTVETPTGSMTLDTPPADFAAALLAEFPSRLASAEPDRASDAAWAANEIDRLLYYIDQVVAALSEVQRDEHRRHAVRFVADNVAQIARLRARYLAGERDPAPRRRPLVPPPTSTALPASLAEQLDALRAWRSGPSAIPWCAAEIAWSAAWPP